MLRQNTARCGGLFSMAPAITCRTYRGSLRSLLPESILFNSKYVSAYSGALVTARAKPGLSLSSAGFQESVSTTPYSLTRDGSMPDFKDPLKMHCFCKTTPNSGLGTGGGKCLKSYHLLQFIHRQRSEIPGQGHIFALGQRSAPFSYLCD